MLESTVEYVPWAEASPWLLKKHYAKRNLTGRAYGLYINRTLSGICVYSSVIPNVASTVCGKENAQYVCELSRLVVDEGLPPNTLSHFVAQTFKKLSSPKIIMSYSDRNQHHTGYIYQALNFIYTGKGGDSREFIINGKQVSTRPLGLRRLMKKEGKYDPTLTIADNVKNMGGEVISLEQKNRYIHFLGSKGQKKRLRKALLYESLPYPKDENIRYDVGNKLLTQSQVW